MPPVKPSLYMLTLILTLPKEFIDKAEKRIVMFPGDQKNVPPPSRPEMKNPPGKLSIAFSNTTYGNIILRFSSTTMHYFYPYDSYCKMNHVSIFGLYGNPIFAGLGRI